VPHAGGASDVREVVEEVLELLELRERGADEGGGDAHEAERG
jgi:hypothetical protein